MPLPDIDHESILISDSKPSPSSENSFYNQEPMPEPEIISYSEAISSTTTEKIDIRPRVFDKISYETIFLQARGSVAGNSGVNDTVVNQLLSKIDGVDQLNNILIIGMTNR